MKKPAYFSKGFVFFLISVIFLWGVCAWIIVSSHKSPPACSEKYRQDKTITTNGHKLHAQTAINSQQQETGLGVRACLGPDQAMLFIFDKPGYYPFWMKDMKFSLDIVWASGNKQVVDIQKNIAPATYPKSFVNSKLAKYVI